MTCYHVDYDDYFERCPDCGATVEEIVEASEGLKLCEDCRGIYANGEGRPYKYEPEIWLCDDCHDDRMEEDA